jgi:A/G-specific adenine glycosylase
LGDVLRAWQGLGYNRRAKMLHTAAKSLTPFSKSAEELQKLPGIGPYTARAVMAFAHNSDEVFIETNIRTAVTHHFFPRRTTVDDREVLAVLEKAHPHGRAREWYAALMDYGAHLKRSGVRLNAKAKGYSKQKTFAGSDRQARGVILKELAKAPTTKSRILGLLGDDRTQQLEDQLAKLLAEGMVTRKGITYRLP